MNDTVKEPSHHRRYRVAWEAFSDPDTSDELKVGIGKEMDSAQNHFEWDEFQKIKVTLVGFCEYWESFRVMGEKAIEKMKQQGGIL